MSNTPPIFIDAHRLHGALDEPDVQIVAVETASDYARGHIPGAVQLEMKDFTQSEPPVAGLLPSDAKLAEIFSDAGLRNDAHIVAYDRVGDGQAARLLYTLDVMGHSRITLLDGGIGAWQEAGYELESGAGQTEASRFEVERQPEGIADRTWIEEHLDDNRACFLDVRSTAEYAGEDRRSARGGHIPGAISLDWLNFKDRDGKLRPREELLELLSSHGVDSNSDITTYCQSHVRSSYVYLVLKAMGYEQVRGYPGAWSDWGNARNTPIRPSNDAGE